MKKKSEKKKEEADNRKEETDRKREEIENSKREWGRTNGEDLQKNNFVKKYNQLKDHYSLVETVLCIFLRNNIQQRDNFVELGKNDATWKQALCPLCTYFEF